MLALLIVDNDIEQAAFQKSGILELIHGLKMEDNINRWIKMPLFLKKTVIFKFEFILTVKFLYLNFFDSYF